MADWRKLLVAAEAARNAAADQNELANHADEKPLREHHARVAQALTPRSEGGEALEVADYFTESIATSPEHFRAFIEEHSRAASVEREVRLGWLEAENKRLRAEVAQWKTQAYDDHARLAAALTHGATEPSEKDREKTRQALGLWMGVMEQNDKLRAEVERLRRVLLGEDEAANVAIAEFLEQPKDLDYYVTENEHAGSILRAAGRAVGVVEEEKP
jgi:hypothetical protein